MRTGPGATRFVEVLGLSGRAGKGPECVAYSVYDQAEWQKLGFSRPGFLRVQKEAAAAPLRLQDLHRILRQGTAPCCCVLPATRPAVIEVIEAASEAMIFLDLLIYCLRAHAVESVGVLI